ncbi:dihydroorotase family protein [Sungkyunkwania multivorans]|uniref:Dihydroorotase family protein n=1 Tax=Sungkyunkwania multivorans TaxID=1173618 RepID=A0ABW3CXN8_9FLAO
MTILLKSATIVDSQSEFHQQTKDILIENGKISKIDKSIKAANAHVISFENLHVSQGWFDSSVNFGEPGYEERETIDHGLEVAAKSGFTAIAVNPNTNPIPDTNADITFLKSKANRYLTSLFPIGALTVNSDGVDLAELFDMKNAGAIAFGDYQRAIRNPNLLKIALQYAQNFDGIVLSFPQEDHIKGKGVVNEDVTSTQIGLKGIPALAEALQIARDIFILEYTGGKLHIPTISTERSVKLIKEAKKKGLDVSCSVAIHHLVLNDEVLTGFDTRYKVLPPLRTPRDIKALIKGLDDGTIDMVTSDHHPIDIEHKKVEFDHAMYGTIGLETAFGALNHIFSTEKTISLLTAGKSRFGLTNHSIEVGNKADISLFDPSRKYTFRKEDILSTSKNSAFLGVELKGKAYGAIAKNTITTQ